MKLSISNIAWGMEQDEAMYVFLQQHKVDGIEIAPTRIFPDNPYEQISQAKEFRKMLWEQYGLEISSMQSIWFGRNEKIFEDASQRECLLEYTKRAFAFAHALECKNLVFGCPKNRNVNSPDDKAIAIDFFAQLGECAIQENTVLALEANPPIYNTNFMNNTKQAYEIVQKVASPGIQINYDLGTVVCNQENVEELNEMLPVVNHIHISEPYLAEISYGKLHTQLIQLLQKQNYEKYISIEMKNLEDLTKVQNSIIELQKRLGVTNGI